MTQLEEEIVRDASVSRVDMKLEVVVIPVSDVDRAKEFYGKLGWRLDADYDNGDDFRVIQFTPPASGCSVIFGKNVTAAAPGSARAMYLIVSDIEAARGGRARAARGADGPSRPELAGLVRRVHGGGAGRRKVAAMNDCHENPGGSRKEIKA